MIDLDDNRLDVARKFGATDTVNSRDGKAADPTRLITHRFTLDKIMDAYDTFGRAAETRALKVIISA